ncbi:MAG: FCD domain-containing protein, partial [Desulfobacterales bacterium]|nr:FCD domain-containing protein [Desulfobacterales bacterium]
KESVKRMEEARIGKDVAGVFEACKVFNEIILYSSKMPRLISMISTLQKYTSGFKNVTMKDDFSRIENALIEHGEILKAIEEKDVIKAQQAVSKHNEASKEAFLHKLDENKK